MRDQDPQETPLDMMLYAESRRRLHTYKSRLPPKSVDSLAREVIRRMTAQDADTWVDRPSEDQITHLAHALLADNDAAGAAFIQDARTAGASIDAVYLQYLAGAARLLGQWWDDDLISFSDVTLGTTRIYAIIRALRYQFPIPTAAVSRFAVFAAVPGDAHTLGLRMATDLFRKDGWKIDLIISDNHDTTVSDIVTSHAPIVGISAGGHHALDALSRLIIALRIERPSALLFVSGQILDDAEKAIGLLGLDGTARSVAEAKVLMQALWHQLQT